MIDLSFCWTFPEEMTPEIGLPRLAACGFEGIELWPQPLERFGTERWAAALGGVHMRCFQVCPYFNFMHGPEKIAQSRRDLHQYIQVAQTLGCRRIRVFTGPPWGEGVIGASEATEAQWNAAATELQSYCDATAPLGIELCLECHAGSLMEDSPSALRLLDMVKRNNVTTNLQLPLLREDWQTSVNRLAGHTTHIHIHNWAEGLGAGGYTFLDEGAFDWFPVVKTLLKARGHLCLSVEHPDHHGRHDPWETARRDGPFLQALRNRVKG